MLFLNVWGGLAFGVGVGGAGVGRHGFNVTKQKNILAVAAA